MRRSHAILATLAVGTLVLAGAGCHRDTPVTARKLEFDGFIGTYNRYIHEWLLKQQAASQQAAASVRAELTSAEGAAKATLEAQAEVLDRELSKWSYRLGLGDYLKVGAPSDIPADLVWQDGMEQPEIGDPRAKKGGTLRRFMHTFPSTIRPFGDNSNNEFRGELYDYIDIPLVNIHPQTMALIPGLAVSWALSADGRTTYFRLNPLARYSDGVPVTARDFLVAVYLRVSDNIFNPFSKQFYREELAQIAMYDERTLSVSLPETKINAPMIAGGMTPSPAHFYTDYGPDFNERYQWRFAPTTGAYEVLPKDIVKGLSITQTRVKSWWARDLKYYRYRFNPDKLVHTVVRDDSKAFELFRAGELDTFYMNRPELWYEKSEIEPVYNGWIERTCFYNRYPTPPRGLYLNVRKAPLDERNVRLGINFALNWQKVIDVMFRGDYQRLNAFNQGYAIYSDPSIKARPYSIDAARAAFHQAGYTREGTDGILTKEDGTRLSTAISYPSFPQYDRMFAILREDAKACGLDLRLDGMETTVAYKKDMLKQYDMTFGSWAITPPIPDFYQFLHSVNALDAKGNPKPQTNNLFVWGRADTDRLCEIVRTGRTPEEVRAAAWKLQHIIHDEGIFVPAYAVDFIRIGSWRWVRWPDCENTRFSPPVVLDPHEVCVLWIDEAMQAETLAARQHDKSFGESTKIVDAYRILPPEPPPPAAPESPH
jgi:microcin C transport system substrate-binding protein